MAVDAAESKQTRRFASSIAGFDDGKTSMIETNPIRAQIADLRARVETLRGYL